MTALVALETVVIALLTLLVAGLLRSHAEILRRLHVLDGGGEDAPATATVGDVPIVLNERGARRRSHDVAGPGLRDDVVHVAINGTRHRTLVAFLSSSCLTCKGFWDAFAEIDELNLPDDVRLVVVTKDAAEESPSALRELAPAGLPVVMSSAAWDDYEVPGSPYFVMVDGASGRVEGEGTGSAWEQVHNLITQAGGDAREVRIDRELLAHGIAPGDPMLYPERAPQ